MQYSATGPGWESVGMIYHFVSETASKSDNFKTCLDYELDSVLTSSIMLSSDMQNTKLPIPSLIFKRILGLLAYFGGFVCYPSSYFQSDSLLVLPKVWFQWPSLRMGVSAVMIQSVEVNVCTRGYSDRCMWRQQGSTTFMSTSFPLHSSVVCSIALFYCTLPLPFFFYNEFIHKSKGYNSNMC